MMKDNHTPGPWYWDGDVTNYDSEIEAPWLLSKDGIKILGGEINCCNNNDANLIAAAPELLAALEEVKQWFHALQKDQDEKLGQGLQKACDNWDKLDHQSFDFTNVFNAIAKAKGETTND